jgi:hypothetical protein
MLYIIEVGRLRVGAHPRLTLVERSRPCDRSGALPGPRLKYS